MHDLLHPDLFMLLESLKSTLMPDSTPALRNCNSYTFIATDTYGDSDVTS